MSPLHTCDGERDPSCAACAFEDALWNAINLYAISVGGDPSKHIYGNTPRMRAVADVNAIAEKVLSTQRINDSVVEDLVKGSNAAAARACEVQPIYVTAKELVHAWRSESRVRTELLLDRLEQELATADREAAARRSV